MNLKTLSISIAAIGAIALTGCTGYTRNDGRFINRPAIDGRIVSRPATDGRIVSHPSIDGRSVNNYVDNGGIINHRP